MTKILLASFFALPAVCLSWAMELEHIGSRRPIIRLVIVPLVLCGILPVVYMLLRTSHPKPSTMCWIYLLRTWIGRNGGPSEPIRDLARIWPVRFYPSCFCVCRPFVVSTFLMLRDVSRLHRYASLSSLSSHNLTLA